MIEIEREKMVSELLKNHEAVKKVLNSEGWAVIRIMIENQIVTLKEKLLKLDFTEENAIRKAQAIQSDIKALKMLLEIPNTVIALGENLKKSLEEEREERERGGE